METAIHLTFRYTEQDYVRAMRAHFASRLRLKVDIAVIIATTLLGAYFWRSPDSHWFGLVMVGLSAIFTTMLVVAFGVMPGMLFRREAKFRDEYSPAFSQNGICGFSRSMQHHLV
jgi:hypothetical protein